MIVSVAVAVNTCGAGTLPAAPQAMGAVTSGTSLSNTGRVMEERVPTLYPTPSSTVSVTAPGAWMALSSCVATDSVWVEVPAANVVVLSPSSPDAT